MNSQALPPNLRLKSKASTPRGHRGDRVAELDFRSPFLFRRPDSHELWRNVKAGTMPTPGTVINLVRLCQVADIIVVSALLLGSAISVREVEIPSSLPLDLRAIPRAANQFISALDAGAGSNVNRSDATRINGQIVVKRTRFERAAQRAKIRQMRPTRSQGVRTSVGRRRNPQTEKDGRECQQKRLSSNGHWPSPECAPEYRRKLA